MGHTPHRVVITGAGVVSCLGHDEQSTWEAMREGRSGIRVFDIGPFEAISDAWPTRIAGQIVDLNTDAFVEPREVKKLDRSTVLGLGAAHEAVGASGIDFEKADRDRCGVVIGSGIGGIATIEAGLGALNEKGPRRVSPFTVPRLMVNATAGNVSIKYGLRGPASAHATACASSGHAIGDAMGYIRRGECDAMLAGGVEAAITPLCIAAFSAMKALSTRNDDPERASRPFDVDRDGFVMAEGGAVYVLESLEHAKARGATILAELIGFGNTCDASHITAPDAEGRGAARSMLGALRDAGLEPGQIDYINAHGTSTALGDDAEVAAVLGVFGGHARKSAGGRLLMSSTKSMHGHALGASGAIEMVACLHAVRDGVIAPTINLDNPDEAFDIDLVPHECRERPVRYAMNNTFGFGGHNTTLIVRRFEG
ncbi:MAG: beta-ketoacyl-ACP synthase II [Phycisphaeraceae bacterium]|nr:MAG: beta-ketoacyl-ACP synthase II [Phycisphaeraceae bacterium]